MSLATGRGHAKVTVGVIRAPKAPVVMPSGYRPVVELASPVQGKLAGFVATNAARGGLQMVRPNTKLGHVLALCGAGPSLRDAVLDGYDDVWACNSALPYLVARGTHNLTGVGIDQSPGLLREWQSAPDVPYIVATSCDPALIDHLASAGRSLQWVHNLVAIRDTWQAEVAYYRAAFPRPAFVMSEGMTVVSRAIGLAQYMGYERIDVFGADCALGPDDAAHANGDTASQAYTNPVLLEAEIDGRHWKSRPDMLQDAVHLVRRYRQCGGRVRLMGDTLPVALLSKDDPFLDLVSRKIAPGEPHPASSTGVA